MICPNCDEELGKAKNGREKIFCGKCQLKRCSKCKEWFFVDSFHYHKGTTDGLRGWCKQCEIKHRVIYRENNRDKINQSRRRWGVKNSGYVKQYKKEYREKNKEKIKQYERKYRAENKERLDNCIKKYREKNINRVKRWRQKQYRKNKIKYRQHTKNWGRTLANYNYYSQQLVPYEECRRNPGKKDLLQVKCAYCGRWMNPTNIQAMNRVKVINGKSRGDLLFYCGEECKDLCPIFWQVLYPKGYSKGTSREVNPQLRQMCFGIDNWTCQLCGATCALECHHEKSVRLHPMLQNDLDNVITLCSICHGQLHKQEGCTYNDLKCSQRKEG